MSNLVEHAIERRGYVYCCKVCSFYTYDKDLAMVHETGIP